MPRTVQTMDQELRCEEALDNFGLEDNSGDSEDDSLDLAYPQPEKFAFSTGQVLALIKASNSQLATLEGLESPVFTADRPNPPSGPSHTTQDHGDAWNMPGRPPSPFRGNTAEHDKSPQPIYLTRSLSKRQHPFTSPSNVWKVKKYHLEKDTLVLQHNDEMWTAYGKYLDGLSELKQRYKDMAKP